MTKNSKIFSKPPPGNAKDLSVERLKGAENPELPDTATRLISSGHIAHLRSHDSWCAH